MASTSSDAGVFVDRRRCGIIDHERILRTVFQDTEIYFSNDIRSYLPHLSHADYAEALYKGLLDKILSILSPQNCEAPKSIDEFISVFESTFSALFLKNLRQRIENFDSIVGGNNSTAGESISLTMLQAHTYEYWAKKLFEALIEPSVQQGLNVEEQPRFDIPRSSKGGQIASLVQQTVATPSDFTPLPGHYAVHQIHLKGTGIREAWLSNDDVRRHGLLDPNVPSSWTPAHPGGFPVFHGTNAHLRKSSFREELSELPFSTLRRNSHVNPIVPSVHGCIYTAFSALRCFLWAAFNAEVIWNNPKPDSVVGSRLSREWTSGGQLLQGVVLFHFSSSQPSVSNLASFTIPKGVENVWSHEIQATANGRLYDVDRAWHIPRLQEIHQHEPQNWPEIIHGIQFSNSTSILPFCGNLWRTVWCTQDAENELNQRRIRTYAISFVNTSEKKSEGANSTLRESSTWRETLGQAKGKGRKVMENIRKVFTNLVH